MQRSAVKNHCTGIFACPACNMNEQEAGHARTGKSRCPE
ncbi:hypothetical protein IX307_001576 [Bacteroides pyogenes]|nr:hypothetical protein [Bacteroides pyogenes]MBR8787251.1 hypothetical protein [Bacteroides pyogenes]MBR8792788.1 hypothetical protein [Bacteroides pyogenes]MBR8795845.1 hypothetical protein [Bacteroides pyogenes]